MISKKDIHLINKEIIQRQKRGITRFLAPAIIGDRIYGKRLYVVADVIPNIKIETVFVYFNSIKNTFEPNDSTELNGERIKFEF